MGTTPPLPVISLAMLDMAESTLSSVPLVSESMLVLTRVWACWQNVVASVSSCLDPGELEDNDLLALWNYNSNRDLGHFHVLS